MLAKSQIEQALKNGDIVIKAKHDIQGLINPNSVDLTLGRKYYRLSQGNYVDSLNGEFENRPISAELIESGTMFLANKLYICVTNELVGSHKYTWQINDKSSAARMGISTHFNGGFGDLGFFGNITLVIVCKFDTMVYPNQRICQVSFQLADGIGDYAENGRYGNDFDPSVEPMPQLSKGMKIYKG